MGKHGVAASWWLECGVCPLDLDNFGLTISARGAVSFTDREEKKQVAADPMDYTLEDHAGVHMARMYSGEEVATICADLQRIFQATIDEVREEAAENVNDAYNDDGVSP